MYMYICVFRLLWGGSVSVMNLIKGVTMNMITSKLGGSK